MIEITKKLNLQDNTGTKKFFVPLFEYSQYWYDERKKETHLDEIPDRLLALGDTDRDTCQKQIGLADMDQFRKAVVEDGNPFQFIEFINLVNMNICPWTSVETYVQYRVGKMVIPAEQNFDLYGVWVMFETNWGDARRGYRIRMEKDFPVQEKTQFIEQNPEFRPPLPYIAKSQSAFHRDSEGGPAKASVSFDVMGFLTITLDVSWIDPQVTHPLETDLIVDLGNTRTVALLMDTPEKFSTDSGRLAAFRSYCRPLRLKPEDNIFVTENKSLENAIVDTWFLLCKPEYEVPTFEEWDIRKETVKKFFSTRTVLKLKTIYERVPHLFTRISPVLCGNDAKTMYNDPLTRELSNMNLPFEQSSPKRYYWHNDSIDMRWCMCSRSYDANYQQTLENIAAAPPNVYGPVFPFMPVSGAILPPDVDLTTCSTAMNRTGYPTYPRAATLTWFLLNILEKAWEQLNDPFSAAQGVRPKYIAHVIGTYPSGWTVPEIEMYKERWQEAINIFHRTHFLEGTFPIELDLSVDEAVAGQLPFLVGEVTKANRNLTNWLKIAGTKDVDGKSSVRVMNIDIGGGTTDISVIEHAKHPDSTPGMCAIDCSLLSKEGFNIAGDSIVKGIIEQIILPALGGDALENMTTNIDQHQQQKRVRIVRGCLIPLANEILKKTILGEKNPSVSPMEAHCDGKNWELLCELIGCSSALNNAFNFSPEKVREIVTQLFDDLLARCAVYGYAYDVDFVFLSGKPSELPVIRDLVVKHFGLPLDRIIVAKNYLVGDWYPFGNGQYIGDAKSVTAVGCAIKHALNHKRIDGWQIYNIMNDSVRNQWSILVPPSEGRGASVPEDGEILGFDDEEMLTAKRYRTGNHLARRQNELFKFEPVYKLVSLREDVEEMFVRFGRSSVGGGEGLEILEATTLDGETLEPGEDIMLRIWPCDSDTYEFWQESGKFD